MKRLTESEIERCARALKFPKGTLYLQWDVWYFFGSLFDRLEELTRGKFEHPSCFVQSDAGCHDLPYQAEGWDCHHCDTETPEADHPCMAICAAIEALEKK